MLEVAVNGTLNVLKACHEYQVKKCVVTGSTDAVLYPAKEDAAPEGTAWTENSWSNPDRPGGLDTYPLSKTMAELKALEYQRSLPEDERFDLIFLHPAFIIGPPLTRESTSTTGAIKSMFTAQDVKKSTYDFVDVRDVALAHLQAVKIESTLNRRFIICAGELWWKQVAEWLATEFNP